MHKTQSVRKGKTGKTQGLSIYKTVVEVDVYHDHDNNLPAAWKLFVHDPDEQINYHGHNLNLQP